MQTSQAQRSVCVFVKEIERESGHGDAFDAWVCVRVCERERMPQPASLYFLPFI